MFGVRQRIAFALVAYLKRRLLLAGISLVGVVLAVGLLSVDATKTDRPIFGVHPRHSYFQANPHRPIPKTVETCPCVYKGSAR